MPLQKQPERKKRPKAYSFRLSESGDRKLRILTKIYNQTQIAIIEQLLDDAYKSALRKHPKEVVKIEKES